MRQNEGEFMKEKETKEGTAKTTAKTATKKEPTKKAAAKKTTKKTPTKSEAAKKTTIKTAATKATKKTPTKSEAAKKTATKTAAKKTTKKTPTKSETAKKTTTKAEIQKSTKNEVPKKTTEETIEIIKITEPEEIIEIIEPEESESKNISISSDLEEKTTSQTQPEIPIIKEETPQSFSTNEEQLTSEQIEQIKEILTEEETKQEIPKKGLFDHKKKNISKEKIIQKKKKNQIWIDCLVMTISLFLIGFASFQLIHWHEDNKKIKELNEDIEKEFQVKEKDEEGELVNPPDTKESDYWYYVGLPFYEVDFNRLQEINSDTVAFIHMESTNINYPVVKTSNNTYYLNHAFDKSKNDAGWVFMDHRNQINNLNDNTIIYGHGRLDKTVFGSLKNALTAEWQSNRENYAIWISTPTENMVFQIFSIYTIQSESYYITTTFNSTDSKQKWLDTMKQRNTAPTNTEVNVNDSILTLSTCENNNGGRIVVQAKLVKRQTK